MISPLAFALRAEMAPACVLLAAILASFGCVCAERIPAGEPVGGRSRCACGRALRPWDLVPVLSWLASAGRARCCGARIPARYLIAEALMALFGLAVGLRGRADMAGGELFWPLWHAAGTLAIGFGLMVFFCWRRPPAGAAPPAQ